MPVHHSAEFIDRSDAGRRLAKAVVALHLVKPVVLALPRGGVPVAAEIARELGAPLDLLMVRKIGAPGHEEYALGAVVDGADPQVVLNDEAMATVRPPSGYVEQETVRQLAVIERRREAYLGARLPVPVRGRTAVVVDDGIATGSTARVALMALRKAGAARIILAVPVAPQDALMRLRTEADGVVCLVTPHPFRAVGLHYGEFGQTSDGEVVAALRRQRAAST